MGKRSGRHSKDQQTIDALIVQAALAGERVVRLKGARFRLIVEPPMVLESTGERTRDIAVNMARVNAILERWVRDKPEQWLWLHNRWPD